MITKEYVTLKYRERKELNNCEEFWYVDLKDFLDDKPFVILEELFVDKSLRNKGCATDILKQFISKYEDTIILVNAGALCKEYPEEPTDDEFGQILDNLDKFFTKLGFENINKYSKTYEYKELYVYPNELGKEFFNKVKEYYTNN